MALRKGGVISGGRPQTSAHQAFITWAKNEGKVDVLIMNRIAFDSEY
jgi:hypothetical protein